MTARTTGKPALSRSRRLLTLLLAAVLTAGGVLASPGGGNSREAADLETVEPATLPSVTVRRITRQQQHAQTILTPTLLGTHAPVVQVNLLSSHAITGERASRNGFGGPLRC